MKNKSLTSTVKSILLNLKKYYCLFTAKKYRLGTEILAKIHKPKTEVLKNKFVLL